MSGLRDTDMCTPMKIRRRTGWILRPRVAGWALLGLMLTAGEGRAQQQIAQDGRLFDANPALDGDRYNYAQPLPPLLGGNPYVTGNVGRGLSLRSFSPIASTTAFHAALGSNLLSNFIRDSVSVGQAYSPGGGLTPNPFFDPVQTVPTVSYLRGFSNFEPATPAQPLGPMGSGAARTGFPAAGELALYGVPPARPPVYDTSQASPSQLLGQPLNLELSSGIFGLEPPRLPGPLSQAELQPNPSYVPEPVPNPLGLDQAEAPAETAQGPLDLRIWPGPLVEGATPLDVLAQENARRLLTDWMAPTVGQPGEVSETAGAEPHPPAGLAGLTPGRVPAPGTGIEPGADVFTDMRLALELSQNPQPEWYSEIFEPAGMVPTQAQPESPTLALERETRAADAAEEFLNRMFEAPLQTFVGRSATLVNDELGKAETAMALGRYYDAVRHYERVRILDPANPLPLIGKGHALLAAGEYVSAATSLINGLERFPELARFQVDLQVLMGGGEVVDIRRADLMKQLERREDPQLRFLLGYLELHAGMTEFGMQNLEKAAGEAEPGSLIRRYPDMVRYKAWLSPGPPPAGTDHPGPADQKIPGSDSTPSEEESK
jgi:hypothetical protein